MHSSKPRSQLLHCDAQGCAFRTELIGGLVVIPCAAILRVWTPFPALLFGLHCQFTPVGISFWRVDATASGKPDNFLLGQLRNLHFQNFSLAIFLKEPELVAVVDSEH